MCGGFHSFNHSALYLFLILCGYVSSCRASTTSVCTCYHVISCQVFNLSFQGTRKRNYNGQKQMVPCRFQQLPRLSCMCLLPSSISRSCAVNFIISPSIQYKGLPFPGFRSINNGRKPRLLPDIHVRYGKLCTQFLSRICPTVENMRPIMEVKSLEICQLLRSERGNAGFPRDQKVKVAWKSA